MDKVEPRAGTAPQTIARPCRIAMYRSRERTVQELLRHTQKIAAPRVRWHSIFLNVSFAYRMLWTVLRIYMRTPLPLALKKGCWAKDIGANF